MKNKWFIVFLTVLITFFCVYFLSFTYKSWQIQEEATAYAVKRSQEFPQREDMVRDSLKQYYLDSIWNIEVYSFLGIDDNTYKDVKKYEINLGLDLQGGMSVIEEVSPEGIIEAMAGRRADSRLKEALKIARSQSQDSQEKFTDLFYSAFQEKSPGMKLNQVFANSNNMDRINSNTTDEEVIKILDEEIDRAVDRSLTILRSRIDKFGVTQPNIQRLQGSNRIQVELAGIDNPERVRKLIQAEAKLEFLETFRAGVIYNGLMAYNEFLYNKEQLEKDSDTTSSAAQNNEKESDLDKLFANEPVNSAEINAVESDSTEEGLSLDEADEEDSEDSSSLANALSGEGSDSTGTDSSNFKRSRLFEILSMSPYTSKGGGQLIDLMVSDRNKKELMALLETDKIKSFFPKYTSFLAEYKPMTNPEDGKVVLGKNGEEYYKIHVVQRLAGGKAPVSGDAVTQANFQMNPKGGYKINLTMNPSGAQDWARLTKRLGANPDQDPRMVAIVLDGQVYSAPRVMGEIPNGRTEITGNFTKEESKDLANVLKTGSLPAKLRIVEEAIVGPSIGKASVKAGLQSMIAGLVLVLIFMILYYNKGGAVANIALFVNIFFIIGLLAQFEATLTLPGIAGIVLTIGMSIDANVLIFERIKEELALGKMPLNAIDLGFKKALVTILDSNITTFVTGVILAYFGSGPVKGFAITLMIGIGCSFFTAVFVSRLIIYWMGRKNEGESLKFDTFLSKGLFQNSNFNFIGKRKMAYMFSTLIIALGITAIVIKGGLNLGVDFRGGRSYVVNFDKEITPDEVKSELSNVFGDAGTEVKVYGEPERLKITTSYLVSEESEAADSTVLATLNKGLAKFSSVNPDIVSSSKVGATIADDIKSTSVQAMIIAIVLIFLYIVVRFRKWQFGLGAVIALVHDVLVVISMFAIARLFGLSFEVDQIFVAAILTIIGYSINDTVVVFDRVREFLTEKPSADTADTFNKSINATISRTLMTSLTTLLVVVVLFFFGGEALKGFSFALLVGILFGTYSSIFIATPVVLDTAMRKNKKKADAGKAEMKEKATA